jgi:hypothetical protein
LANEGGFRRPFGDSDEALGSDMGAILQKVLFIVK